MEVRIEKIWNRCEDLERHNINILSSQGFPKGWYLASIDLAKRDNYRKHITSVKWDVVIVDEVHRVGKIGGTKETQRYKLVSELVVKNPDVNVIFLSATPHRGDPKDYISRLKLLDPYLVSDDELDDEFYCRTREVLVFRRTK